MTRIILTAAFLFSAISGIAQLPVQGGDTSFSLYSAYTKAVKKYPDISPVTETHSALVKEEKNIVYCESGERKLLLDAFYSTNRNKLNGIAVIIIHGGGWRSGNRAMHYPMAQRLAALGYTCITPEYRLSAEALFPAAVQDIKEVIKWTKQKAVQYHVDMLKICLLGFSAGGELVAFAGATASIPEFERNDCINNISTAVNAVIDIDGTLSFVHPESSEGDDSKKLSAATQWLGVAKKDSLQLWKKASPLTYVNRHTPPTLFINSSVPSMHAGREDYIRILDENKIYTEVHSFNNAPHTFCLFNPWFGPTVQYINDFLIHVFHINRPHNTIDPG